MKKDNVIEDSAIRIAGEYFSLKSANFDKYPIELQNSLLETENRILWEKTSATELETLVDNNPGIPEYKILLFLTYNNQGRRKKSLEIVLMTTKEHPDYLASRLYLGLLYIIRDEIDKVLPLFNGFVELEELFPGRTAFLPEEVDDYLMMGIMYFAASEKISKAAKRFKKLEARNPDYQLLDMAEKSIEATRLIRKIKLFKKWNPKRRTVECADRSLPQLNLPPAFENPEIEILYSSELLLSPGEIDTLLSLPRKSFIRDLERVILDARQRYHVFFPIDDDHIFPEDELTFFLIHAVLLLTECRSTESLPVIMGLLEENESFFYDWFGDYFDDCLVPVIYQLGQNQLDSLKMFIFKPNIDSFSRVAVPDAVSRIVMHKPERRNEVIRWLDDIFNYFISHSDDDQIIDTDAIGFMVVHCMDIKAFELIETIKTMFDGDLVSLDISGYFDDVLDELKSLMTEDDVLPFLSIYEQYEYFKSEMESLSEDDGDEEDDDDEEYEPYALPRPEKSLESSVRSFNDKPQIPVIAEKTPGRNDPCPCGSGKKYKKCCLAGSNTSL